MAKIMIFRKGYEYSMMKIQHFDNIHIHDILLQAQTPMHQASIILFPNNTFANTNALSLHNLTKSD